MYSDSSFTTTIIITLVSIAFLILLFLILRKFFLWYYRINDAIAVMERVALALEKISYSIDDRKKEANPTERYTNPEAIAKLMGQKRE